MRRNELGERVSYRGDKREIAGELGERLGEKVLEGESKMTESK